MSLREGWEQCQETLPQRSCISLVKATSHRTHTRAAWPTWVSCEGQRDKTVSVCDWVNTQRLLCVRTIWVTHVQRFCFLFSLCMSFHPWVPLFLPSCLWSVLCITLISWCSFKYILFQLFGVAMEIKMNILICNNLVSVNANLISIAYKNFCSYIASLPSTYVVLVQTAFLSIVCPLIY